MSQNNPLQTSIWSSAAFPARTSAWPEIARDWMEADPASGSSSIELYQNCGPELRSSKMSLVYLAATEEMILPESFEGWQNSGICRAGESWTLSFSESHSAEGAYLSSLWQILEEEPAPKYYLSAKACAGILRRAENRGRDLPEALRQALEAANR